MRPVPLPALAAALVPLTGCGSAGGVNLGPVGDGLSFIGVCVVVAMLVLVVGLKR